MENLALAFLAGLVTILNPCVLPIVPLVVGAALGKSRFGPLALAAGLVTSFTIFGFAIITVGFALGIDENAVRFLAGSLLIVAGIVLMVPRLQLALSTAGAPISNLGNHALGKPSGDSLYGQGVVGFLLGLVWAPCVGPTLGVAIAAASTGQNLSEAFVTFLVFGLGVAISILGFAYGSRRVLRERRAAMFAAAKYGKLVFAFVMALVGAMVVSGLDKSLESALLEILPSGLIEFTTRF